MSSNTNKSMDDIVALCRRRGFIWQSSEIYGGINGFWDYGPLGAAIKKNLKDAWWNDTIVSPPDGPDGKPLHMVPVETTIIMHPKVWEASGHVAGFNDPMVECKETHFRYREDHLYVVKNRVDSGANRMFAFVGVDEKSEQRAHKLLSKFEKIDLPLPNHHVKPLPEIPVSEYHRIVAPDATEVGTLMEPRQFSLMFDSHAGPIKDDANKVYLRPETAQGIFTQFWNVVDTSRVKTPFGIAQMGKSFRNEVTPRNFTFRSREFEQMEIEFFIPDPDVVGEEVAQSRAWYAWWRDYRFNWWQKVGLAGENLILREHDRDELAHYAKDGAGTSDVEYRFPFTAPGFGELEGVAHRTNFDLRQHAEHCGKGDKMRYFDQEHNAHYFPHVIEPSAGADRGTLALLCEAYTPDDSRASKVYMNFTPRMAPIKAAIFPLVNKDGMPEKAEALYRDLRKRFVVQLDVKQNIGKRYARMDEAGTPYCFTVDGDSLNDNCVTVRERNTQSQERISIDKVEAFLAEKIGE